MATDRNQVINSFTYKDIVYKNSYDKHMMKSEIQ